MRKSEVEKYCPKSQDEWRKWLEENHRSEQSVWLIYYRTFTKIPSPTWSEAVDEALCFGWIDSTKKTIDKDRYMQYFSRRKTTSTWSKINKGKVAMLIQDERMSEAGYLSIETAKQNGTWTMMDDVEKLIIPEDLKTALTHKDGMEYFNGLSKSMKKILLHWIVIAKRSDTRKKRIVEIAGMAAKKELPKPFKRS